jgi:hypothetical protein
VTLDGFSRPHDGSNGGGSGLTYGIPRPPGQPITIGGAAVPPGRRLHPDGRLDGSSSSSSSTAADLDTETGHSSGVLANNDIDEEEWGGDFCAAVRFFIFSFLALSLELTCHSNSPPPSDLTLFIVLPRRRHRRRSTSPSVAATGRPTPTPASYATPHAPSKTARAPVPMCARAPRSVRLRSQ